MARQKIVSLALAFIFGGCGTFTAKDQDTKKPGTSQSDDDKAENNKDGKKKSDNEQKSAAAAARIADGKYYVSAAGVEAFDNLGNKLDPQTLQITGDYTWTVRHLGAEKYEVTATGSAKFSNSSQVVLEVNCKGTQDVYMFTVLGSNALRDLKVIESGCPQGIKEVGSQQMTLEPLNDSAFVYTIAEQSEGTRVIESFSFHK